MSDVREYFGHSATAASGGRPEPLLSHLEAVSARARELLAGTGLEEIAALMGLWHDLGKYSDAFQQYIGNASADSDADEAVGGKVDHSTVGAKHAADRAQHGEHAIVGRMMAYCIAGHHAGLPDWSDGSDTGPSLRARLRKVKSEFASALRNAPRELLERPIPPLPEVWRRDPKILSDCGSHSALTMIAFSQAMACRMLFSALVDADRLETERFCNPAMAAMRSAARPSFADLSKALQGYIASLPRKAGADRVNGVRAEVLSRCRERAGDAPGFYSLTVPTGGGKTLSSLSFALEHCVRHGLRRVIYLAPYTSIIEQNADTMRKALSAAGGGEDVVLEHHSARDPEQETERSRLLTENWDAPVIVSTNVQFFDSLFSASTSACRKLHNIARSVIILDEAQTLRPSLLAPCLAALRCLVYDHGCTVVLCTATQPALTLRDGFGIGLRSVPEIMGDSVSSLFDALERVRVEQAGFMDDASLAEAILAERSCLCIVNTRAHAASLFQLVRERDPEALHLSASLCPEHRAVTLVEMRSRLKDGRPCRVVSTQVVEAGVDVDFPVVFRALAGLDSIAQAAGRCNREGTLPDLGRVVVYRTNWKLPLSIQQAADHAGQVLPDHPTTALRPEAIARYFEIYYDTERHRPAGQKWDEHQVLSRFSLSPPHGALQARFRQVAAAFKMIYDWQEPIIVPYGMSGMALSAEVERIVQARDFRALRRFQRRTVTVSPRVRQAMLSGGAATLVGDSFCVLINDGSYDRQLGLRPEVVGIPPELFIQ